MNWIKARVTYSYLLTEPHLELMKPNGSLVLFSRPGKPMSLSTWQWLVFIGIMHFCLPVPKTNMLSSKFIQVSSHGSHRLQIMISQAGTGSRQFLLAELGLNLILNWLSFSVRVVWNSDSLPEIVSKEASVWSMNHKWTDSPEIKSSSFPY